MTTLKKLTPKRFLILMVGLIVLLAAFAVYSSADDPQESASSDEVSFDDVAAINEEDETASESETVQTNTTDDPFADIAIPQLPFPDNPDPNECGIPQQYGTRNNTAYLNGVYEDELIQPTVYLYDSHGRSAITAAAEHGTQVEVILFQANPVLDYYFVKIPSAPKGQREGWVPEPFLSFEPVSAIEASAS